MPRDLDPDLLARRIKQTSNLTSEQARRISEESCRRVDRERREQADKPKPATPRKES